ncbi:MAG: GNAT family N-acetyltransferase [Rhodocyclaceae bacterium]|nr:GNAT family N-acetyltransferase [Rhodocyclaceae bacterium]
MSGNIGVEIRAVRADEVEAIGALARVIWQAAYLDMIGQGQIDYMLAQRYGAERMREELARPDIWWRQILVDGQRLGFYACQTGEKPGELKLDKLYVHPGHQRRGLGGRLLAHASELARGQGCHTLVLAVHKGNAPAIAAYKKHGFAIREPIYIDIGGGYVMDDYLMEKRLTAEARD